MSRAGAQRGAANRGLRSLEQLDASASTARTLNLLAVWRRHGQTDEYKANPFFKCAPLNRSIIVKHRLRRDELSAMRGGRSVATKVILPIDVTDLRAGARSFFIGQHGYRDIIDELAGAGGAQKDEDLLELIDSLPSLDPFLMRERLKQNGYTPDRCYFDLTDADLADMFEFVRREVQPLIGASFGDISAAVDDKTSRLAEKILSNQTDDEFEPFRQGIGLGRAAFDEGIYCWKGFIYYKWCLNAILPSVRPIQEELRQVKAFPDVSAGDKAYIDQARGRLIRAMAAGCDTVRLSLKVYDDAFADLTHNGQPTAFREFLLKAPGLFHQLGERLGGIQHIMSFWRYRFPAGSRLLINGEELADIFADFEIGLSFDLESSGP